MASENERNEGGLSAGILFWKTMREGTVSTKGEIMHSLTRLVE